MEIVNKTQNDKLNLNSINVEENNNQNELSSVSYIKRQLEEYPEIKPILMLLKDIFILKKWIPLLKVAFLHIIYFYWF